jgi:hypothetical protein
LNNIGFAALLQGYNVAHGVLENSIELTEDRYDALFSGMVYDRLKSALITKQEREDIRLKQEWANSWSSRLKVIKGTPKDTSMADFVSQLEILKERDGFVPDVFLLDYLNIMNPSTPTKEERLQQQRVLWDMKKFVDTWGIPIITATQSNTEGNKAMRVEKGDGKGRLNSSHQGKSIDISQGVDVTITINQSPEEKDEGILAFLIELARDANITNKEIIVNCDIPRMLISREIYHLWPEAGKMTLG